jgi:hypothetical protein
LLTACRHPKLLALQQEFQAALPPWLVKLTAFYAALPKRCRPDQRGMFTEAAARAASLKHFLLYPGGQQRCSPEDFAFLTERLLLVMPFPASLLHGHQRALPLSVRIGQLLDNSVLPRAQQTSLSDLWTGFALSWLGKASAAYIEAAVSCVRVQLQPRTLESLHPLLHSTHGRWPSADRTFAFNNPDYIHVGVSVPCTAAPPECLQLLTLAVGLRKRPGGEEA